MNDPRCRLVDAVSETRVHLVALRDGPLRPRCGGGRWAEHPWRTTAEPATCPKCLSMAR